MKQWLETPAERLNFLAFSILERIDVGETGTAGIISTIAKTFSILERIDVGETGGMIADQYRYLDFQYPRTDRRG